MRMPQAFKDRVVELDRRYRSTWDAHAIAHVVGLSATTVAKILREVRGPRPKRAKRPHTRRTRFLRRDVMWSSDFVRIGWGWLLMRTVDEMSGYRLGWDLCRGETAAAAVAHARALIQRMGRMPLVWKYDHGSAFTSKAFQDLLAGLRIVAYPTQPHAPWTNGRVERDHQDVHAWLIPLIATGREPSRQVLETEIDEGMLTFNYVKPRAVHGFRRSAEVYFDGGAKLVIDEDLRDRLHSTIFEIAMSLGAEDAERMKRRTREQRHRKTVRLALQKLGLYEEWDVAAPKGSFEEGTVNKSETSNVSF